MKLGNIDRTKDGPAILTRRLNQLQHAVNYLMRKKRDDITPRVRGGVGGIPPLMCEDEEESSSSP